MAVGACVRVCIGVCVCVCVCVLDRCSVVRTVCLGGGGGHLFVHVHQFVVGTNYGRVRCMYLSVPFIIQSHCSNNCRSSRTCYVCTNHPTYGMCVCVCVRTFVRSYRKMDTVDGSSRVESSRVESSRVDHSSTKSCESVS